LTDPFLPLISSHYVGYTTIHDRNENNSTPPSSTATQMSYLQMNSLRNGSNSGNAGNQNSIYPMLKEENNSSSSGNNSSNYPSLSELSVSSAAHPTVLIPKTNKILFF